MSFNPYLFFDGDCAEAFAHYQEVFGGDLQVLTQAEVPEDARMPGADPSFASDPVGVDVPGALRDAEREAVTAAEREYVR